MGHPTPHTLDYAEPIQRSARLPWFAGIAAASFALCCHWTAFYCGTQEPFLGKTDWRDIFALRVLPFSLVVAWVAWAFVVVRRMRPRRLATLFLAVGVPLAAWSCFLTLSANRRFESDRAQVAEWYRMAAEDGTARQQD